MKFAKKLLLLILMLAIFMALPVAAAAEETVASGTCGENVTWTLDAAGTLTISGTGAIYDYSSSEERPWFDHLASIKAIVIEEGITRIGKMALSFCYMMKELTIPTSITSIGSSAFLGCNMLEDAYIFDPSAWCKVNFEDSEAHPMYYVTDPYYRGTMHVLDEAGNEMTEITLDDSVTAIPFYGLGHLKNVTRIVIPDSVTSIGNCAFQRCESLTSIEIPNGVTTLGISTFWGCKSLTEVTIPDSVTRMERQVFYMCSSLKRVRVPDGVTQISDSTFQYCDALEEVILGDHVASIGNSAFSDCRNLRSVNIPDSLTKFGNNAFCLCSKLESIAIPDGVTTINQSTFYGCGSLTNIEIPDSVTEIEASAFEGCGNLTSVTIGDHVLNIGKRAFLGCTKLVSIVIPKSAISLGSQSFSGCKALKEITFEGNAPSIGSEAFGSRGGSDNSVVTATAYYPEGNSTWTSDVLQNYGGNLTWVPYESEFSGDGGEAGGETLIASGTCGESVTWTLDEAGTLTISGTGSIGVYSGEQIPWKSYSAKILNASVEDGVTNINFAFSNCSNLVSAEIADSVTNMTFTFDYCSSLTSANISSGVTELYGTFADCSSLTSIDIPESVTAIDYGAFDGCSSLTSITIPDSVTFIGNNAFGNCTQLSSVTIPASVTEIRLDSFIGCTNVADVYISDPNAWCKIFFYTRDSNPLYPGKDSEGGRLHILDESGNEVTDLVLDDSVTQIPTNAFIKSNLISVVIPDSVTQIKDWAFSGCTELKSVDMGKGVTEIGNGAFERCTGLTEMNLPDSVAKIAGGAFSGCERLTSVTLPYVISMGGRAFENCTSLTSIEMPYVLEIQGGAFESCTGLTSITIPASVTTIRSGAFRNCLNLKTVTFVGDAPKMASLAFGGEHPYEKDTVVTATAYYPEGNPTWTEEILQDYGGNMTWISYTPEVEEEDGSAGTPVASGSGGENVRWELDSKGKLRVFGTGAIADSEEQWITDRKKSPWYDYRMKIKSAVIEDSVTRIGNYAFEDCTFLETVTICDSVTHIGNGAFWNCLRLKYLTIGKGVAVLEGSNVFDGCSSLMHVYISDPSAWCNMECSFFSHPMHHYNKDYLHVLDADGNEVTEIVLDESVRTIVQNTFRNSSLTSITFSSGLTRIDTQAFIGSSKLRQLTFIGDAPSINEKAFQDVTATAYYHEGNPTWTSDVLQDYGGQITWIAKCTNHSVIVEGVVQPTCARTGTTGKVSCENCGEVLAESKELPMLDHQWDKGVDADGVRTYQCLYCGTTDTKQLPPADMTTAQPEISETLMDSILTKNEKSEVSNGAQVEVYLDVTDKTDRVSEAEIMQIEQKLGGGEVGIYLDIDLYKQVGDNAPAKVTETKENISISITIPEALRNSYPSVERNYGVIRVHEGVAEKLEGVFDSVTNIFTFETDSFSTYALTLDDTILPHEHSYEAVVQTPTCTEIGSTAHTCALCGDSYVTEEIAALGHDVTYEVETAPTLESEGTLVGTCTRCGEKLTATLPKLSKADYTLEVITEPTKEAEGFGKYTWTVTDYGTFTFEAAIPNVILGDVNDDGAINVVDLMYLANYFAKGETINKANADVNNDGTVDVRDLMFLANVFAGKETLG